MRRLPPKPLEYAIVQHSAMGYKGDVQFNGGLETRMITNKAPARKVTKAMGLLFENYSEAEDYCDWAMYEWPCVVGLIPRADKVGSFSTKQIDGLRIYLPYISTVVAWNKRTEEAAA